MPCLSLTISWPARVRIRMGFCATNAYETHRLEPRSPNWDLTPSQIAKCKLDMVIVQIESPGQVK